MPTTPHSTRIRFATFELDVTEEQLRNAGSLIKLAPQPLKVLTWLATHAGHLVTRQELFERTWGPGTFVDFEQGLNHCIKQIRLALGDDAEHPRFIETIPKRGYRFIAEVQTPDDRDAVLDSASVVGPGAAADRRGARRWSTLVVTLLVAAALAALAVAVFQQTRKGEGARTATTPRATLAVLPLEVLNQQEEIGYLALGIPDAITARLARAGEIRIRPTAAVIQSDPAKHSLSELARLLETEYLLTGTLQQVGDHIRVSLQLVHGTDMASLWAQHFDRTRDDLLSLEDAIAEEVAAALRIPVTPAERTRFDRRYTSNARAYEFYLKGRSELLRFTKEGTLAAIAAFDAALQADPNYALAHAGLATADAQMHLRFAEANEVVVWRERAQREAALALQLDPELAEVHEALAAVYGQTDFDWARTISESRAALRLNPNLPRPHYHLARAYYHYGLLEIIESEVAAGLDIDPVNQLEPFRLRGTAALVGGRFEEATKWLRQARELSGPTVSDWYYAQALYYSGDHSAAEEILHSLRGGAQGEQRARATLASFVAASGDGARANSLIAETLAAAYMDHHVAYSLGAAYAQLGQSTRALTWLRKSADSGFPCFPWFSQDPLLRPLRDNPEFGRLLADLEERLEAARAQYK
ncbi:MAG TPA: winged helix-turn-helix domain-containing protein [Steroidobacteraceae bacterium]|nr:winged helix-turn-helix domain-containing protein [Steroidobacteraceae bacterium]